ncbi:hypothetical protein [Blastomonas sp. SL216]|uniref:hypothetical protein n=1 Tax=Blastomonas sp. SL216 TaxID=2995169 RepID=UPI002376F2AF|nr:hypothetical protein OU999_14510 [Blastomonas sp. SL216]
MISATKPPRLSVGLSDAEHQELLALAERHNVSMAWVGRQAIIEFMMKYRNEDAQLPLALPRERRKMA